MDVPKKVIQLYPGFLVKDQGKILWCSERPILNDKKWICKNFVDVTNCISDPWPYYSGDEKSILIIE